MSDSSHGYIRGFPRTIFMKKSSLTQEQKTALEESGYSKADIHEISIAVKKTSYYLLAPNGTRLTITETEAKQRLGMDEWLKAIARSAFHAEAVRYGLNNEKIALHSKIYA